MAAESLTRLRKNEEKEAVFMTLSELIEREAKDRYEEGRAEGHALISHKSSRTTTCCWTPVDWKTLDPTKKRYPASKGKGEAPARW